MTKCHIIFWLLIDMIKCHIIIWQIIKGLSDMTRCHTISMQLSMSPMVIMVFMYERTIVLNSLLWLVVYVFN